MRTPGRALTGIAAALALAACDDALLSLDPAPTVEQPAEAAPVAVARPGESLELERFYARIQANLLARGLLRTDGGGPDTAFGQDDLVRNFERIALFEEYTTVSGRIVAQQTVSKLHRWEQPIRIQLAFGVTVPRAKQDRDRVAVTAYAARLGRLTGLPIRQVTTNGNFHIFIVNEDERKALGPQLRKIIPGISDAALATVRDLPRSSYCLVFASDPNDNGTYDRAVAVIRAEHPDLLRLSCIHEEIAQGMGLANDSPSARPSLFNDDEEFGLLTEHDELLLKMLYDRRMRAGMTAAEAMPVARVIAAELVGGES